MKQQIIEALKAKFVGVSDAILGRVADKLAKTTTNAEDIETAVAGVSFQQVLESYGDSRATEAQVSAVKNYESKHNLKDGKPVEAPKPQPTPQPGNGGDEMPAWAKALVESNKALTDKLHSLEAERTTDIRKTQLARATERLPEAIRKIYDRTPIENMTDDDFTALLTDVNGEVEAISQTLGANKGGGGRPIVAAGGGSDKLTKEQMEAITKREGKPSADGQPF